MDGGVDGGASVDAGAGADAGASSFVGGDGWISRIAGDQSVRWQMAAGAAGSIESAEWGLELSDSRILVVGSAMGDADPDAWLLFVEARGAISIERRFGGAGDQRFVSAIQLSNGDVVAIGLASGGAATTEPSLLMARFTLEGEVVWQSRATIAGATRAVPIQVLLREDGRLVFLGAFDDPTVGRGLEVWVGVTDLDGALELQRSVGTPEDDLPAHAAFAADRGLIFAGRVAPTHDPTDSEEVTGDLWVVKVSAGGAVVWQRLLQRVGYDEIPRRVIPREDGRIDVIASADGFGSRAAGDTDVWIVELSEEGSVDAQRIIASLSPDRPVNAVEVDPGGFTANGMAIDDKGLTIAGVVNERPTYWTITDGGGLVDGCGKVLDTDALVIDTSVQVEDGLARYEPTTFTVATGSSGEGRPPPLGPLVRRVAP